VDSQFSNLELFSTKNYMNIDSSYKWPFIAALIIHVLLVLFLFVNLTKHNNYSMNASSVNIIKAVVINNNQSHKITTKNIEKEQNFNQNKEEPVLQPKVQQQSQIEALKQQKINAQRAIEIKKKQEKELALAKQKQLLEEQKKLKAKQDIELKQAKTRELMQKNLQKQLMSEQEEVAGIIGTTQNQGKIDKYKAQIIQSIAQYWIVPDNVSVGAYCQLLVRLAPGGQVLSIELIRSSGNEVLDRSAKTAVLKASPLPVPEDLSLFDSFRELRLTVRPEGVVAGYN